MRSGWAPCPRHGWHWVSVPHQRSFRFLRTVLLKNSENKIAPTYQCRSHQFVYVPIKLTLTSNIPVQDPSATAPKEVSTTDDLFTLHSLMVYGAVFTVSFARYVLDRHAACTVVTDSDRKRRRSSPSLSRVRAIFDGGSPRSRFSGEGTPERGDHMMELRIIKAFRGSESWVTDANGQKAYGRLPRQRQDPSWHFKND